MFSTTDTIVAIATPAGRGGIGVVRISGAEAQRLARELTTHAGEFHPRHATFTEIAISARSTVLGGSSEDGDMSVLGGSSEEGGQRTQISADGFQSVIGVRDHAIVTFFPAPHSYTGEDVVEISAHGSPTVLRAIVSAAGAGGARLAEPGEFTLRAFLNGRMDLLQAEAVADLVDAVTPLQARVAFDQLEGTLTSRVAAIDAALFDLIARLEASVDFPDEGYQFVAPDQVARELRDINSTLSALAGDARVGRIIREGARVSIVGRPNVGKSSVFNALIGVARAIVTDVPGTTRDLVTETIDLDGLEVTLVDTAGLRETDDRVEAIGVDLAKKTQDVSDLILIVVDSSQPGNDYERRLVASTPADRRLVIGNKVDLAESSTIDPGDLAISALTGAGVQALRSAIVQALDRDNVRERPSITNVRHAALVERARAAVGRAIAAVGEGALPEEFVLADLQEARGALEEIVGRRAPEDLLAHIFSRFCIGK